MDVHIVAAVEDDAGKRLSTFLEVDQPLDTSQSGPVQAGDAAFEAQGPVPQDMAKPAKEDFSATGLDTASEPPLPQDLPISDADRRKLDTLGKKVADMESRIEGMQQEKEQLKQKSKHDDPSRIVKHHIHLLHRYNEIKDVGMGLLGMIAEQRGIRVKDVMDEFGLGHKD